MATETGNTAAGNAITIPAATLAPCFAPENLMQYHLMLSLMESLRHDDILSAEDHAAACRKLAQHFGVPEDITNAA